jgi:hypothetical protein
MRRRRRSVVRVSSVDAYELAYREAVCALEQQRAAAAELRGRASALIATASVTVTLLGPRVFTTAPFGWLATVCFVVLSVFVLKVLWPRADWRSSGDPRELLMPNGADGGALALRLIGHLGEDREANATQLARVMRSLRTAACLLVAYLFFAVVAAMGAT